MVCLKLYLQGQHLLSGGHYGHLQIPVEDVVATLVASGEANHQVTPHSEADIQPAGEEDGQLGVAPCTGLAGGSPSLGAPNIRFQGLLKGLHIGFSVGALPEVVELLPEVLCGLRHVDIAVLPEGDGEAVDRYRYNATCHGGERRPCSHVQFVRPR